MFQMKMCKYVSEAWLTQNGGHSTAQQKFIFLLTYHIILKLLRTVISFFSTSCGSMLIELRDFVIVHNGLWICVFRPSFDGQKIKLKPWLKKIFTKGSMVIKKCPKRWKKSPIFLTPPPPLPRDALDFFNLGKIGKWTTPLLRN